MRATRVLLWRRSGAVRAPRVRRSGAPLGRRRRANIDDALHWRRFVERLWRAGHCPRPPRRLVARHHVRAAWPHGCPLRAFIGLTFRGPVGARLYLLRLDSSARRRSHGRPAFERRFIAGGPRCSATGAVAALNEGWRWDRKGVAMGRERLGNGMARAIGGAIGDARKTNCRRRGGRHVSRVEAETRRRALLKRERSRRRPSGLKRSAPLDRHLRRVICRGGWPCAVAPRIVRVLRLPNGNALLLGVGGSGRQSLCRLGAFACDFEVFQVEVAKSYSMQEPPRHRTLE